MGLSGIKLLKHSFVKSEKNHTHAGKLKEKKREKGKCIIYVHTLFIWFDVNSFVCLRRWTIQQGKWRTVNHIMMHYACCFLIKLGFFLASKHLINHSRCVYKYSFLQWITEFSSYPLALIMPLKGNRFIIIMFIWWNELCLCRFIFLASAINWNIYLKSNKSISSLYDTFTAHFLNSFSRAAWFSVTLKSRRKIIISVTRSTCCCIKWKNRNNLLVGVKNMINCRIMGFIVRH